MERRRYAYIGARSVEYKQRWLRAWNNLAELHEFLRLTGMN
jgi:hypothetical protein